MPLAQLTQEVGGHDDKEKEPASHVLQVDLVDAPTALEYVPEEHGKQALVPSPYVPATHAVEQVEDPAAEYVPALHARQVAMLVAPVDLEEVPAVQGMQSLLTR